MNACVSLQLIFIAKSMFLHSLTESVAEDRGWEAVSVSMSQVRRQNITSFICRKINQTKIDF